jgi:capsular polysaccharide biosynthesis protein
MATSAAPRSFRHFVRDTLRDDLPLVFRVVTRLRERTINALVAAFPRHYIGSYILAQKEAAKGGSEIRDLRIIEPSERVKIGAGDKDPFSRVAQYYRDGWFTRPDVFVCEVPHAIVHVRSGMVCTPSFKMLADEGLEHRRYLYPPFRKRRPSGARRVEGLWATLSYCNAENFWHWIVDCVPKLRTLEIAARNEPVTIFMPSTVLKFQRYMLETLMPPSFTLQYVDTAVEPWLQPDRFLWSSLVSYLCIGLLPQPYYDAIREPIFRRVGLPATHQKQERIYVGRRNATHRRVRNEDALVALLEGYGFRSVQLETLPFEEQVALFHRAEIVVGPHGAGLGTILFSGDIDVLALYSTADPGNYFHSLACGLGQRHHFVCHNEAHEDDWFDADLAAVKQVLERDIKISPLNAAG